MKLLIDENISPEITFHLRTLKYNVKSIRECCKDLDDEKIDMKNKLAIITEGKARFIG